MLSEPKETVVAKGIYEQPLPCEGTIVKREDGQRTSDISARRRCGLCQQRTVWYEEGSLGIDAKGRAEIHRESNLQGVRKAAQGLRGPIEIVGRGITAIPG